MRTLILTRTLNRALTLTLTLTLTLAHTLRRTRTPPRTPTHTNDHLRLKVLNIFSVISYHTEKSTNLLSLSECFEARKDVVIHQKQFYYEI